VCPRLPDRSSSPTNKTITQVLEDFPPGDYAHALERLHGALRRVDMSAPHFTDRLAEIQRWLADGDATPDLADEDRELLLGRVRRGRHSTPFIGSAQPKESRDRRTWARDAPIPKGAASRRTRAR